MTFLQCLKTWQLFLPSPSLLSCVYTGKKCENESGYEIEISCIPNHHQVSVEVPLNSHFFTWSLSLSGIYWSPLVLIKFGHFYNFKSWTYGVQTAGLSRRETTCNNTKGPSYGSKCRITENIDCVSWNCRITFDLCCVCYSFYALSPIKKTMGPLSI